ncbi:hypothetical protein [Stagnimonas aquatica]|uniref:hypothetical protein n=1 Tax=Stagnimonas aquatica TaxID=2689987 RepID=UPI0011CE6707|nr:hypothetical protein [Stagnimonas aquatica]
MNGKNHEKSDHHFYLAGLALPGRGVMTREGLRHALTIPTEYSLTQLRSLLHGALENASGRGDGEYVEHLMLLMLGVAKRASQIRKDLSAR